MVACLFSFSTFSTANHNRTEMLHNNRDRNDRDQAGIKVNKDLPTLTSFAF